MLHRTLALGQRVLLKMDTRFGTGYDSSLCMSGSPKQQEYQKHTLEPRETLTLSDKHHIHFHQEIYRMDNLYDDNYDSACWTNTAEQMVRYAEGKKT